MGKIDDLHAEYDAVITYQCSAYDIRIARNLYKCLKKYRIPGHIKDSVKRKHLKVMLEDWSSISSSQSDHTTIDAISKARFLIIIASPDTPNSRRIEEYIRIFKELGKGVNILTLLIRGEPSDSFPTILRHVGKTIVTNQYGHQYEVMAVNEPLAADTRAGSLRKSLKLLKVEKLRIIAPIIGCGFDDLKQRNRERLLWKVKLWTWLILLFSITFGLFMFVQWRGVLRMKEMAEENMVMAIEAVNKGYSELPGRFDSIPDAKRKVELAIIDGLSELRGQDEDFGRYGLCDLLSPDKDDSEIVALRKILAMR
jgi:hypothetical protein